MKRILFTVFAFLLCFSTINAQQNFFNVPSSDITAPKKLFFQQQFNFYKPGISSNTTLSYGLGHNMEAGINLLGVAYEYAHHKMVFDDHEVPYAPVLAANFQKLFVLSKLVNMGVGTQVLMNRVGNTAMYAYNNFAMHWKESKTKLVTGLYFATDGFFGEETRNLSDGSFVRNFGIQAGLEQNLWNDKWLFQADFISGKHSLGNMIIGGAYCIDENWIASAGWQFPTFGSKALNAFVVEMTYIPKVLNQH